MIVATGQMGYAEAVLRARDLDDLELVDRERVLEHLQARYPEAVAAVLDDLLIPTAAELRPPDPIGLLEPRELAYATASC